MWNLQEKTNEQIKQKQTQNKTENKLTVARRKAGGGGRVEKGANYQLGSKSRDVMYEEECDQYRNSYAW